MDKGTSSTRGEALTGAPNPLSDWDNDVECGSNYLSYPEPAISLLSTNEVKSVGANMGLGLLVRENLGCKVGHAMASLS